MIKRYIANIGWFIRRIIQVLYVFVFTCFVKMWRKVFGLSKTQLFWMCLFAGIVCVSNILITLFLEVL